jgi:hypothetical protein
MLQEYEKAEAHLVGYQFQDEAEVAQFQAIADSESAVAGLLAIGRLDEARRVALNTITVAMVSDCMHHVFEALSCMERRKFVVALNVFRKPLLDSLVFLSWMLGDEDGFYEAFTRQSPKALTAKAIGNRRSAILASALSKTDITGTVSADWLDSVLFSAANKHGLYWLFQRAVHLVTVLRDEFRTEPQNFNFIFKPHTDDDVYLGVSDTLPGVMLYLSHVVAELFDRMEPMDSGSKMGFTVRSIYGFHLVEQSDRVTEIQQRLSALSGYIGCATCKTSPTFTHHNAARIVMTDSFRCTACKRITPFPFSWVAENWHDPGPPPNAGIDFPPFRAKAEGPTG